jgi:hypothetical protein
MTSVKEGRKERLRAVDMEEIISFFSPFHCAF